MGNVPFSHPVAFLHALRRVGGGVYHVVSRVGDYDIDHTGRANIIAHHVAVDERDNMPVCGPAALLLQQNFFMTAWQGAPRLLPPRQLPSLDVTSQPNAVSEQIAEAAEAGHQVTLIFEPGIELLPIIADALTLLPPEKRWQVTFSTFFISSQESAQEKIQIKGILAGSPEMAGARSTPETLCIDLRNPQQPQPVSLSKPKSSVGADVMASNMKVKRQILCPHCWHEFDTDQILFISASPDLLGDAKLGDTEQLRFLPMRFDVGGAARDSHGFPCHKLACPNCHLQIPRSLLYGRCFFASIAGAPSSGKSYLLATMMYQLRHTLARSFYLNFTDADAAMNERLRRDESKLFLGSGGDATRLVTIAKTEEQGDIYNQTLIEGKPTMLAQPFTFTISPMPNHPMLHKFEGVAQTVCVYDNAGESFLPGKDLTTQPVTRHLAKSEAILFLLDPTQDTRFLSACQQAVNDPQMDPAMEGKVRRSTVRQETILNEMTTRVRAYLRLPPNQKHTAPLIIVLTKSDAWHQLVPIPRETTPWAQHKGAPIPVFNVNLVAKYSQMLRNLLLNLIPDVVSTAETFSSNVSYVAVSATGGPPSVDPKTGDLCYRVGDIQPFWAEVPFLYAQYLTGKYSVPVFKERTQ